MAQDLETRSSGDFLRQQFAPQLTTAKRAAEASTTDSENDSDRVEPGAAGASAKRRAVPLSAEIAVSEPVNKTEEISSSASAHVTRHVPTGLGGTATCRGIPEPLGAPAMFTDGGNQNIGSGQDDGHRSQADRSTDTDNDHAASPVGSDAAYDAWTQGAWFDDGFELDDGSDDDLDLMRTLAPGAAAERRFLRACARGNVESVRALLLGAAGHAINEGLYAASAANHPAVVGLLLGAGADVDADSGIALRTASQNGHVQVVRLLLGAGALVHHNDSDLGGPPCDGDALCDASANGHEQVVSLLLDKGANVHVRRDQALRSASKNGHLAVVDRLLLAEAEVRTADLGPPDAPFSWLHARWTSLVWASYHGHASVVARILACAEGHALSSVDAALRCACHADQTAVVAILVDMTYPCINLADIALWESCKAASLDTVAWLLKNKPVSSHTMRNSFMQAVERGHVAVVRELLSANAHADPNLLVRSAKALQTASALGNLAMVEYLVAAVLQQALRSASMNGHTAVSGYLIAAGAGERACNDYAFLNACRCGNVQEALHWLAAGADPRFNADEPLILASQFGHEAIVGHLLSLGASVHAGSGEPLCVAARNGHLAVVQRLLAAGANVRAQNDLALFNALVACYEHADKLSGCSCAGRADTEHVFGRSSVAPWLENQHVDVVERIVAEMGTSAVIPRVLAWAVDFARLELVERLLQAGVNFHRLFHINCYICLPFYPCAVLELLVAAGVHIDPLDWSRMPLPNRLALVLCVPSARFSALPEHMQVLWLRFRLRFGLRLGRWLQRARTRLSRPPSTPISAGALPTQREDLIAHLSTAGPVYAREYWTHCVPLFYTADQAAALGPVPDCFRRANETHPAPLTLCDTIAALLLRCDDMRRLVERIPHAAASLLLLASAAGQVDAVQRLLETGAAVVLGHRHEALRCASAHGHVAVVQCLVAFGVNVDGGNGEALRCASRAGHVGVVDALLTAGANVHAASENPSYDGPLHHSETGWTALCWASYCGHADVVERLVAAGAGVPHDSIQRGTFLACQQGRAKVLRRLLAAGADVQHLPVNLLDEPSFLFLAARNGRWSVVEVLLATGAYHQFDMDDALRAASQLGHLLIVDRLLAAGADVRIAHESLISAAENGHLAIVDRLLAAGVSLPDVDGVGYERFRDALCEATRYKHLHVSARLLAAGEKVQRILEIPLSHADWAVLVPHVPRSDFEVLPPHVQQIWLRYNVRLRLRLRRCLIRARDRLDRPPSLPLGVARPTREELIAHLLTAGRRFAREYWTDGIPLFLSDRTVELGPLPREFVFRKR